MFEDLYLEGKTDEEAVKRLAKIISILRSEEGCPWDKAQTHESLKPCLVEEAYEVLEAIDNKDWDNLEEELGDVLLQVIFHSDLGKEEGKFDLKSIANRECEKMIRRHPHIFSNFSIDSIDTVVEKWENMKQREAQISYTESMKRIPKSLPALRKSYKVQAKAAQVGFDWNDTDSAFEKITEETKELFEAYKKSNQDSIVEELGDLLFAVVNVARFLQVDPEDALNFASQKFIRRFGFIESSAKEEGRKLEELTLSEMDKLWEDSKALY
ncbi:MAG: nucleoside triphosphate pyrophosphohydrolase [Clostridiales bacterium]|jgi:tetrapyrrole methylase family protein/MazG family protein|nr:nucleoside triphosphate pyrophosphohydrolase [Clostridiales bacterium]